jgi:hypothetical protein
MKNVRVTQTLTALLLCAGALAMCESRASGQSSGAAAPGTPVFKVDPKTVQAILRHSRIETTLDLYTQGDGDETRAAQGAFAKELGLASELIQ